MMNGVHPLAPMVAQFGRIVTGVTTRWVNCQPSDRQRVYYANHTSHLDTVVIWSSFPSHIRRWVRPVGGMDYWTRTWLRKRVACRIFNSVLVERNQQAEMTGPECELRAKKTIQQLVDAMGERYSLIV